MVNFALKVDELRRRQKGALRAIEEVKASLVAAKESLMSSTADPQLYARTHAVEQGLNGVRDALKGNPMRTVMNAQGPVSVSARLDFASYGARTQAYGPTPAQLEALELAEEGYGAASDELDRLIEQEYRQLIKDYDAAGVPWTPGRGAPGAAE